MNSIFLSLVVGLAPIVEMDQPGSSLADRQQKALGILERATTCKLGWLKIVIQGNNPNNILGGHREVLIVRRDGRYESLAVVEKLSAMRVNLKNDSIRFVYVDLTDKGLAIAIMTERLPDDADGQKSIQATLFPEMNLESLQSSLREMIASSTEISEIESDHSCKIVLKSGDITQTVRLDFTRDELEARKQQIGPSIFERITDVVSVKTPDLMVPAFGEKAKAHKAPIKTSPDEIVKKLTDRGIKVPKKLGKILSVHAENDYDFVGIRVRIDNREREVLVWRGFTKTEIPKHLIRKSIQEADREYVHAYDPGVKVNWLYCLMPQYAWFCAFDGENDEPNVLKIFESISKEDSKK